jgi:hypothetical protein
MNSFYNTDSKNFDHIKCDIKKWMTWQWGKLLWVEESSSVMYCVLEQIATDNIWTFYRDFNKSVSFDADWCAA